MCKLNHNGITNIQQSITDKRTLQFESRIRIRMEWLLMQMKIIDLVHDKKGILKCRMCHKNALSLHTTKITLQTLIV